MMSRPAPLALLSLSLLCAAPGPAATAEAAGRPAPARFADPQTLKIGLGQLPLEVVVLNDSVTELSLSAALDGPIVKRKVAPGKLEPFPGLLVLAAERITLPAAGSARVVIDAMPEADRPPIDAASYPGYLVLASSRPGLVLRREILLTVGGPDADASGSESKRPAPTPLFASWTIPFSRYVPFSARDWAKPGYQPLKKRTWSGHLPIEPLAGEPMPPAEPIGHLASRDREAAAVYWTGIDDGQARLELRGIDRFSSKYEGAIDFQPDDDEAGKVTLTVTIKDHWVWALVCLAVGIWVALRLEQFVQVRRGVWLARERNAQLGIDFEAARKRFREETGQVGGSAAGAGFSIAADMEQRRRRLRDQLGRLEGLVLTAIGENADFVAAQTELERLETAAASWPGFASELAALDAARRAVRQHPPSPSPLAADPEPACLALADSLLLPAELTLDPVAQPGAAPPASGHYFERRPQILATTSLVEAWLETERQLQQQREIIGRLLRAVKKGDADHDKILEIRKEVATAWDRLWQLETGTELAGVVSTLDSTRGRLAALAHRLPKQHPALAPSAPAPSAALRRLEAPAPPSAAELVDDRERRDYYAGLRRRYEGVTLLVAFALAVISGLKALYFGQAFATPWHYVQALTWGAGTKLALDTVLAGIGHLPALVRAVSRDG